MKADSLYKTYKKNSSEFALKDFSYTFKKGQITGLIGINGAGKSTLLKILALQLFPTKGKIEIDGTVVDQFNAAGFKNKIGFVRENTEFFEELTVNELLKSTLEFYENQSDYGKILQQCSLEKVKTKKIKTLSKGYKQRLSFAIALSNNPEILILDEAMSGFDPIQINEIRNLILSLKKDRIIIIATHIMQEINILCDKIIILHNGIIIEHGSEKQILEKTKQTNLEKAFLSLTDTTNEAEKDAL
ncbi:MAG: ABC transporter ATP-binding protein [Treponemataceae bacterium]